MVFSLEKVSGYINIALENICAGDSEKAILVLCNNHMEFLFRAGYSSIINLQERRSLSNVATVVLRIWAILCQDYSKGY